MLILCTNTNLSAKVQLFRLMCKFFFVKFLTT